MRVPLSWLRDFAAFPDDVEMLRLTLDDLGLVVEEIDHIGEGLDDVVVARIDEIAPIEGADKVRLVVVDAGEGPLEIVCGATNFALGDLVPLAPVGAVLPGGFEIAKRKMRGVTSNGMLCSGRELGLGDDHAGLMILTATKGALPGANVAEVLGVEPDVVFDIAVEGNRPDAWSIAGVARDLAARLNLEFSMPSLGSVVASGPQARELASARLLDEDLCSRLSVTVLTNVVVADSPEWIARRLTLAGMRPINNVVDASNYVMLELGQPTHPYDLGRVAGPGLRVRRAIAGETLTTLDGIDRSLGVAGRGLGDTGEDCVICDADDVVIGIAGIMGGATSEIDESTTEVLLEAATFDAIAITRTSRRLALRTEAAARFTKGTDPGIIEAAVQRFADLVALSSPSLVLAPNSVIVPDGLVALSSIEVPLGRIESTLGVAFGIAEVASLLEPRGFTIEAGPSESITVTIPSNRPDIRRSHHGVADVIEEVARTYGYSRLPRRAPAWPQPGAPSERNELGNHVRSVLCALGADEAWTSSLVAPGELDLLGIDEPEIVVTNPLTVDESRLRRSLLPGLLRAVGQNDERRVEAISLFEIGATFVHPSAVSSPRAARAGSAGEASVDVPVEPEHATLLLARDGDDATTAVASLRVLEQALGLAGLRLENVSEITAEAAGLHPTRAARVLDRATGSLVGVVGEVDPGLVEELAPGSKGRRIGIVDLDLDVLADTERCLRKDATASLVSRFPSSDVDLAFALSDEVPADRLIDAVAASVGDLAEAVRLFDVYRGDGLARGERSLALRCRLCSQDRTLTDSDLAAARDAMIAAAASLGAVLR